MAQACRDGVEQCVREFGGLDILVNVAGKHQMRRTESMTDDDWTQDLAVNLNGPFYLCRAALPHVLERGGNIINLSSIAGVEGQAYSAGYCAAKHGLIGLTRALAADYTADRLRVNAVCPGGVLTPQLQEFSAPDNPNYDPDHAHGLAARDDAAPRCCESDRVPRLRCRDSHPWRRLPSRQRQSRDGSHAFSSSTERFPKPGEGRCAPTRILHHPPMSQSVEHLRAGAGPVGCPALVLR